MMIENSRFFTEDPADKLSELLGNGDVTLSLSISD